MRRRESRIVRESGNYRVIEIEFVSKNTGEVISTCYEVRNREKFLVEFDSEREAMMQLEFMLGLDRNGRG